jgi:hypothetical protein
VTRRKYLGKSYDVSWVPQYIQESIHTALSNGMSEKELQRILGNAKICSSIINESEKKQDLLKIFPESNWFMYPKVRPIDIIDEERRLKGLSPTLIKRKIPLSKFLEGEDYEENSDGVSVSPRVMRHIVRFFLDRKGRCICIQKGKSERGKDDIFVVGEIARAEKPRSDLILLDKFKHNQRKASFSK